MYRMSPFTSLLYFSVLITCNLDPTRGQEVDTINGRIRGKTENIEEKSLHVFHGIPFAKPPVDDLRFKHPQPVGSWRPEVKDAILEKSSCMQSMQVYDMMPMDKMAIPPEDFSEDCLYLSIWKPASAHIGSNLTVMVWIHGGGFSTGSTRLPFYNGQYLAAENDVVVVSISYRLGALGFSFLGPDTIPGNMGLMDQVEGMKWVKNNIKHFGGDDNRITLFGESAGGTSVGLHLTSPLSRDLFNNGILQSGTPILSIDSIVFKTPSQARDSVTKLSTALKCSGSSDADIYECLMEAEPMSIITVTDQIGETFTSVIDGHFLPNDPMTMIKNGRHKKANILTGTNKDETTLFYYPFLDPNDKTMRSTGEKFSTKDVQMGIRMTAFLVDTGRINALETFYESEQSPPLDYLQILTDASSDVLFKCSAHKYSLLYTESNDVYMYSLNHRISSTIQPEWMGVPHGYDIPFVFGVPLNVTLGFTQEEMELSRTIRIYWTNFAKSGNPNSPVPVKATWSTFDKENQTYMALDVGSNLATRHGFRRHQCAFVNDILPMIPKDGAAMKQSTPSPNIIFISSGSDVFAGSVYMVLSLLTVIVWMLQ